MDDELTEWERQVHGESAEYVTVHLAPKLIAALRASRAELAALSWATREYDEDTGYCLCGCCRHGI